MPTVELLSRFEFFVAEITHQGTHLKREKNNKKIPKQRKESAKNCQNRANTSSFRNGLKAEKFVKHMNKNE